MLNEYPIVARNLVYKAGFKRIIDDVSVALKRNEFVGLIGGSGSGKTTLLNCLNGFREPSEGTVAVNGLPRKERKRFRGLIGYVPQDDTVHATLTVERALYYSCLLRLEETLTEEKIKFRVDKLLYRLDLWDEKHKKISSLSGGQRKRVCIGVELLHSPPLFFLDEPTAGLDPALERRLMGRLSEMTREDRTVVLTTHLMQNVSLFDILIFIHKGRLVYFGPPSEITDYFKVKDMIDLFERILPKDPVALAGAFKRSRLFGEFLSPRLKAAPHV